MRNLRIIVVASASTLYLFIIFAIISTNEVRKSFESQSLFLSLVPESTNTKKIDENNNLTTSSPELPLNILGIAPDSLVEVAVNDFNPDIAICSKTTIAEVEEIVPLGSLDPDEIDTPGIFVQRIVKGETYNKPTSAFINASGDSINVPGHVDPVSLLIAKRVAQELKPGMFVKLDLGIPNLVTEFLEKGVIVASALGLLG